MTVRMLLKSFFICVALVLAGCSTDKELNSVSGGVVVWKAFVANGDKPGVGFCLTQRDSEISGDFFLLDPNKPGDFKAAGRRAAMKIARTTDTEIHFTVVLGTQVDNLVFKFHGPLAGEKVEAILQDEAGTGQPRTYVFVRQK